MWSGFQIEMPLNMSSYTDLSDLLQTLESTLARCDHRQHLSRAKSTCVAEESVSSASAWLLECTRSWAIFAAMSDWHGNALKALQHRMGTAARATVSAVALVAHHTKTVFADAACDAERATFDAFEPAGHFGAIPAVRLY